MAQWLTRVAESLAELVAPSRCCACDAPTGSIERAFCDACASTVEAVPADTVADLSLCAAARYAGAVAQAIRRLKFEDRPDLAGALGRFWAMNWPSDLAVSCQLVPVPLHPHRLSERKYNQSALLAKAVARSLGVTALPLAVKRVRATAQQALLSRSERIDNVRGAFVGGPGLRGRRVIVVDDVLTTGATARACAEALQEAGAHVIALVALARATAREPPVSGETDLAL